MSTRPTGREAFIGLAACMLLIGGLTGGMVYRGGHANIVVSAVIGLAVAVGWLVIGMWYAASTSRSR